MRKIEARISATAFPSPSPIACLILAVACGGDLGGEGADDDGQGPDPNQQIDDPNGDSPPADDPATPPESSSLPGSNLFSDGQVLEVRLTLSATNHEALEERGNEEQYVPAQATIRGVGIGEAAFAEVGLRHKGAYSLHHCWDSGVRSYEGPCAKLSYKIKFHEYQADARLDGVKRLNLHASSGDGTRLHELLGYDTFRAFGVDAPRTAVAKVYVNDVLEGLFIAVEVIDGRYAKAHFAEGGGDGNLYKEVWPSPEATAEDFLDALRTNEEVSDVSGFVAFADAVGNTTNQSFAEDMASWIDVEQTLRYVAVDRAIKNWDGIMAFYQPTTPHNFYFYHDSEGSGQFHLVPWDLDNTFWDFDPYMAPEQWVQAPAIPDWNQEPLSCNARPVWEPDGGTRVTPPRCDTFLDRLAETHWERFESVATELLDTTFGAPRMNQRLDYFADLIEPIVAEDPYLNSSQWRFERDALRDILRRSNEDLRAFVEGGLIREGEAGVASRDEGLSVSVVNDFEAAGSPGEEPVGVYAYGDAMSGFSAGWNFDSPLSGQSDLRFDFELVSQPGVYDEWVNLGFATAGGAEVDLGGRSRIVMMLSADRARNVRVRLSSPAYWDTFGGVWSEFGVDVGISTTPTAVTLELDDFSYPSWARDAWQDGQGWVTSDAEAYAIVRSRFDGLIFAPSGTFDQDGQLTSDVESGYLQIDDVRIE